MATFSERYAKYYGNVETSRRLTYRFLSIAPATVDKPTFLFIHGFPSHSHDWHHQIEFLHNKGYGVVVPDMLGYGGTDKPVDIGLFKWKDMAQDVIDILDSLDWIKTTRVISVSHDWGSSLNGRVMLYHTERFVGFIFTSVGPLKVTEGPFDFDIVLPIFKQLFGYELLAYQEWFAKTENAAETIEKNIDSFIDLLYPAVPETWKEVLGVRHGIAEWMYANRRGPRGSWLSEEDALATRSSLLAGGLESPLNWYKLFVQGINLEDDADLVGKKIDKPILYVGATRDYACPIPAHKDYPYVWSTNVLDMVEFETGHWIMLEEPERYNKVLEDFVQKI